jgi:hypothetical protein
MKLALSLALLIGLLIPCPRARAAAAADDAAASEEVKKLIDQLGDGEYAKREQAAKRLKAIGKPALPALKAALTGDDAEVVARAQAIIKRIEVRPLPAGDPNAVNALIQPNRVQMGVVDGNRVIEVVEGGREIKITDGPDGVTMSVTGLVDGVRTTEEYSAKDAPQLKAENPEAYALYERWTGGPGAGFILRGGRLGGQVQIGGGVGGFNIAPAVPDELTQLRARLEKQMRDNQFKDEQRDAVTQALEKVIEARTGGAVNAGMEKYTEQCDELRKTLEQFKLDPGELLPPPAKTRLGISLSTDEDGRLAVQRVAENSRAQRIGLKAGDAIRTVDGKAVTTVGELRKLVGGKEKGLTVEVTRDGQNVTLEEKDVKEGAAK